MKKLISFTLALLFSVTIFSQTSNSGSGSYAGPDPLNCHMETKISFVYVVAGPIIIPVPVLVSELVCD